MANMTSMCIYDSDVALMSEKPGVCLRCLHTKPILPVSHSTHERKWSLCAMRTCDVSSSPLSTTV